MGILEMRKLCFRDEETEIQSSLTHQVSGNARILIPACLIPRFIFLTTEMSYYKHQLQ